MTGSSIQRRLMTTFLVVLVAVAVKAIILTSDGIMLLMSPIRENSGLNESPLYKQGTDAITCKRTDHGLTMFLHNEPRQRQEPLNFLDTGLWIASVSIVCFLAMLQGL